MADEFKKRRANTKGCMTRIKNLVEQTSSQLTLTELQCRLGILESYFKQILDYQSKIEDLTEQEAAELKVRSQLEDLYCATKSKIISLMDSQRRASLPAFDPNASLISSAVNARLPTLRLPNFSGKYSDFQNFYSTFEKLVHSQCGLSKVEKFNHLLMCLSGPALNAVKAFEVSSENYTKALAVLTERFDNKYLVFQEHINDLFDLPKAAKNSASQLRSLIDHVSAHFNALQSLGTHEQIANALIIFIAVSKLDSESQAKWEESVDLSQFSMWDEFSSTLGRRCQYLEARAGRSSYTDPQDAHRSSDRGRSQRPRRVNLTSLAAVKGECVICSESSHSIYKCPKFAQLSVSERFNEVKTHALCLNCLGGGHSISRCKSQRCRICQRPHHTLLHRFTVPQSTRQEFNDSLPPQTSADQSTTLMVANRQTESSDKWTTIQDTGHVFLATAVVYIRNPSGRYLPARALLDSASQLNFITENLAHCLELHKSKTETCIKGIGENASKVRHATHASICSRLNKYEVDLLFHIIPTITGLQPEHRIDTHNLAIPANIELADPGFNKPQKVDLLLGAECFFSLLCTGQIKATETSPVLQKTLLGWIVSGRYRPTPPTHNSLLVEGTKLPADDEEEGQALLKLVERFWEIEDTATQTPKWTQEQLACESIFIKTVQRLDNGRFVVSLPFKANPNQELGNSLEAAKRRFTSLEKRLTKYPQLKDQYVNFLRDYVDAGHMEQVDFKDVPKNHYFMPHHAVLRPDSSTTKLRVVFDASFRTTSNKSLNDCLMVGPTVQQELFLILLRFRFHKYALTADISAMYRQILLDPKDRHFQYIVWRENPTDNLQAFRLKTVTYGTAAAPFLATRCLKFLASLHQESAPVQASIIEKDFYVDDLLTGGETEEELRTICQGVQEILDTAHFPLRKWYSNHSEFLKLIPTDSREKTLKVDGLDCIKALGLVWEPATDEFRFHHQQSPSSSRTTKRTVLADIARLFDLLGLINPIIVKAKTFLQELWILKVAWDESLPMELETRWNAFKGQFPQLNNIKVPRHVLAKVVSCEVHGFSDASERAYGCCLYMRCIDDSGNISVRLLCAKSKVAPTCVARSLPCLELCAAELLAQLWNKLRTSIPI